MINDQWVIIDTETTGISQPIYVVEIAAQKMIGLQRDGKPFRRLINQNEEIPADASRVHGYTREILERDGQDPNSVYQEFSDYVGDLPIVAYNLSYDWDDVLIHEWERLGIDPIGTRGFCAYHLTQRLLDPSPAGNFKLQSLRQYFRLPERGAHTALGDVDTVIDLFEVALSARMKEEGLKSLSDLTQFAEKDWFPSKIPFGKFKGVDYRTATNNTELYGWIEWLSQSKNTRSSKFGNWYLKELKRLSKCSDFGVAEIISKKNTIKGKLGDKQDLEKSIEELREKLGDLSSTIMSEKSEVGYISAELFKLTNEYYRKRDQLHLTIKYRKRFLDILLIEGEEEAEGVVDDFQEENNATDREYEDAASSSQNTKSLSKHDQKDLKNIWKQLARVYHPDNIVDDPDKHETYQKLTSTINNAKEEQNIELLKEIAEDSVLYVMKQGWKPIDIDYDKISNLKKLWDSLTKEIDAKHIELKKLRNSSEFEIMKFCQNNPTRIQEIANKQIENLEREIAVLKIDADKLGAEMVALTNKSLKIL